MPPGPQETSAAPAPRRRRPVVLLAAGAAVLLALAGAAAFLLTGGDSGGGDGTRPASVATPTGAGAGQAPAREPEPSGEPTSPEIPTGKPGGDPSQEPLDEPTAVPSEPPAAEPAKEGDGVTYQVVQRDGGYYEGRLTVVNRTGRPLAAWRLTFEAPGADVRNVWGARLVRGGAQVEITNLDGAAPVPPGGTWEVRFGAAGTAATPRHCLVNGAACGL